LRVARRTDRFALDPLTGNPLVAEDALSPPAESPLAALDALDRRDFLRLAGLGTTALVASACAPASAFTPAPGIAPAPRRLFGSSSHVVVIGAGAWGSWTSFHLRQRGADVTLIDAYGAGNSRSTSGDETRGIRSSYGDRTTGEQWCEWARAAIKRWETFDAEWGPVFKTRFFVRTGDVIMRATDEPFTKRTREIWEAQKVPFEAVKPDEAHKRWPTMKADDINVVLYEPDAGVARARASTQAVAAIAEKMGVKRVIGRARLGAVTNGRLQSVLLDDGTEIKGDTFVFACGPWFPKLFPELMAKRMRIPLGYVCYFGPPQGDTRWQYPNHPSFNFPGVTGWPALPVDFRGFRVRGAVAAPPPPPPPPGTPTPAPVAPPPPDPAQSDPDLSSRWMDQARIDGSRRFLQQRFPILANAPLLETRCCHYETSVNRNFIVDNIPNVQNAWIAGVGQAEGFKFAPVAGEYVASRVLGDPGDPYLAESFKLSPETYETAAPAPTPGPAGAAGTRPPEEELY
jgi:glycine/D-amino acid oxidase-like deaminating enzyme